MSKTNEQKKSQGASDRFIHSERLAASKRSGWERDASAVGTRWSATKQQRTVLAGTFVQGILLLFGVRQRFDRGRRQAVHARGLMGR